MQTRTRLALAATALVGLAGCGDTTTASSEPADSPTSNPTKSPAPAVIPDDFPLAAALPRVNGDDGTRVRVTDSGTFEDFRLCGEAVWSPDAPERAVDVAGVTFNGEAEDTRSRTLALYEDRNAATAALIHARDTIRACPLGTVGGTDQLYEEVAGDANSATFTHRYRTDGNFDTGLEVVQLVRAGNALYLASYYGEGGGSPRTIASSLEFAADSSAGVVTALRAFGA